MSSTLCAAAPLAVLLLAGCTRYQLAQPAAPPIEPLAEPPAGLAQICVVRPAWEGGAMTMVVRDNGHLVGATRAEAYFCWYAEPGPHHVVSVRIDAVPSPRRVRIHTQAGRRYYLAQDPAPEGGFHAESAFQVIDDAAAEEMLAGCDYEQLTSVPGQRPPALVQLVSADPDRAHRAPARRTK
jgi:hypothetical protein